MVEIKAYDEQQKGLDREARTKQHVAIEHAKRQREIARKEATVRKLNRKEEYAEHKEVQDAFDKHMELARVDDEMFTAEIRASNKTARELQRRTETRLLATQRRDRPYAAKINDAIMTTVRATQERDRIMGRSLSTGAATRGVREPDRTAMPVVG